MNKVKTLAVAGLLCGSLMTQAQAIGPQPFPPSITPNVAAVQSACAEVRQDTMALDISRATHDSAGVSANLTALKADQTALRTARQALATSVQTYMQPARDALSAADTAYETALTQLKSDVIRNPGAVTSDTAKLQSAFATQEAARAQVQANQQALAGAGAFGACAGGDSKGKGIGNGRGMGSGGTGSAGGMGSGGMGSGRTHH